MAFFQKTAHKNLQKELRKNKDKAVLLNTFDKDAIVSILDSVLRNLKTN